MIKPYYEEENIIIYNNDCLEVMKELEQVNIVLTSPPYNVGVDYIDYKDNLKSDEYFKWTSIWLKDIYNILKDDGRFILNIPYEVNMKDRGGRVLMLAEYWQIMKEIGFGFYGIVDLVEDQPEKIKYTAWGSWQSASNPYIYNPKECLLLAYKNTSKRIKNSNEKIDKQDFIKLTTGCWVYKAQTKKITQANFSNWIPVQSLKMLSFKDDIVLDPFLGSGTTARVCKDLGRKCIGIEISKEYCDIAIKRLAQEVLF